MVNFCSCSHTATREIPRIFASRGPDTKPVSAADRAREEYERAKKDQMAADVQHLAQVAEAIDPAQAKAMRQAIDKP